MFDLVFVFRERIVIFYWVSEIVLFRIFLSLTVISHRVLPFTFIVYLVLAMEMDV